MAARPLGADSRTRVHLVLCFLYPGAVASGALSLPGLARAQGYKQHTLEWAFQIQTTQSRTHTPCLCSQLLCSGPLSPAQSLRAGTDTRAALMPQSQARPSRLATPRAAPPASLTPLTETAAQALTSWRPGFPPGSGGETPAHPLPLTASGLTPVAVHGACRFRMV